MEALEGANRQDDEDRHDNELGGPEGRRRLRGSNGLERGRLGEELRKQDKDIEVEGQACGEDVSAAPAPHSVSSRGKQGFDLCIQLLGHL